MGYFIAYDNPQSGRREFYPVPYKYREHAIAVANTPCIESGEIFFRNWKIFACETWPSNPPPA